MINKRLLFFVVLVLAIGTIFAVYQVTSVQAANIDGDHHDGDHHGDHDDCDDDDDDHDGDDDDDHHGPQLFVDNDKVECPTAQYTSIQAAVNAAPSGATINVCPGTYPETVRIIKSITVRGIRVGNKNLILIKPSIAAGNTTSLATGNPIAAIVLVERNANVTLDDLTVDGANNLIAACAPNLAGIFYRNASGKVKNSAVRNIRLSDALFGCQNGFGILAQSGNEIGVKRGSKLEVSKTSVHDYQKNGITGNESGTELITTGNAVTGVGPSLQIAQNGIQIGYGARGTADGNSVINNNYSACTPLVCNFTASNILVFSGTSGIKVLNNNLGKSQINVFFGSDSVLTNATYGLIEGNTIFDSDTFGDGIYIDGNNNTARYNKIFNSDEASVFIDGNNNKITGNFFNEAPIGVLVNSGTGNQITSNSYFNIAQRVSPASLASSSSFAQQSLAPVGSRGKVSPSRP
jgi:hypothetical protein